MSGDPLFDALEQGRARRAGLTELGCWHTHDVSTEPSMEDLIRWSSARRLFHLGAFAGLIVTRHDRGSGWGRIELHAYVARSASYRGVDLGYDLIERAAVT